MSVLAAIGDWSPVAFGLLLLAAQLLAHETGYRVGRRESTQAEKRGEGVGVVVGGMLALLAFVLALTLSFASTRFGERRQGALAEANAIGTAWLRAEAIGHPRSIEIARLLEDYTQVRADFVRAGRDPALLDKLNQRTNALQTQIWGHLAALVREAPNPVSTSLMAALNDVFDRAAAERFAFDLRLPERISWLLLGLTLLSMAVLGYQLGLRERPARMLIFLLALTWSVVIVDILDLASARLGALRTSAAAYQWTLQGFKGGLAIPPLPGK